uniref:Uncharacterized protein n=1 Tax=Meloidogyne incognita TaxID=6306 RepID=A0A914KRQ9_MELIC
MQSAELAIRTNTYSLRARKQISFDRDYSPPEQPPKKRPKVQTTPKKVAVTKRVPVSNVAKFATPAFEDTYFIALKSGKSANTKIYCIIPYSLFHMVPFSFRLMIFTR